MKNGYTLIELMVVITIMGILGFTAFANFGSLKEDQVLKKAAADLQTRLRAIQTNASTNTKCNDSTASFWKGKFSKVGTAYKLDTSCEYKGSSGVVEYITSTYTFEAKVKIANIISNSCTNDLNADFVIIFFAPLTGKATFKYPTSCTQGSQMSINLLNSATPDTLETVVVDKGGSIYVKNKQ